MVDDDTSQSQEVKDFIDSVTGWGIQGGNDGYMFPESFHSEMNGDKPCTNCVIGEKRYLRVVSTVTKEVEAEVFFYTCTTHGKFFKVQRPIPRD